MYFKTSSTGGNYIIFAAVVCAWVIVVRFIFPWEAIPYQFEEFVHFSWSWTDLILTSLPLFAIGFLLNLWKMATSINPPEVHENAPFIPINGLATSLFAGVFEEICFRWVILYGTMGFFWLLNVVFVSTVGIGLPEFPFINKWIVGSASGLLEHPGAWTLGWAVLASNWKFQNGHLYQGWTGWIFSWIGGMFFFRITFEQGIVAAMIVHFAFDLMIFMMLFVDVVLEQLAGFRNPKRKFYQWY